MFIGHFGVALAAKSAAPRTSLGTLVFAAQFVDLLWPVLLLAGIEHVQIVPGITRLSPFDFTDYPWSHSLVMTLMWSILVGGIFYAIRRRKRDAWLVGGCVLSHWVLDFIVHRPDLPLYPGGVRVGLGLWNSWASIPLEVTVFAAGLFLYLARTHATQNDQIGRYGFWALMTLLFLGWVSTLFAGAPANVTSLAWGAMTMWLTVPWAWWADRHRTAYLTSAR